ncbi:MAG: hypothetical protein CMH55_07625 [Myxococcales bacterium]|nr:hypothetical protein [Myxococcales bacterium]|tara:strand:- start:729 stop:926 length:198 start_codon:yes stop_codon:yes gene_type:complete
MPEPARVLSVWNEKEKRRYAVLACPSCGGRMLALLYAREHTCETCGDELELDWDADEEETPDEAE